MAEFSIGLNRKKQDTLTTMEKAGIRVVGGQRFDSRVEQIIEHFKMFMADETKDDKDSGLHLSVSKKWILKQSYERLKYVFRVAIPFGEPADNPKFGQGMEAVVDLLLMARNLAFSKTSDDNAILLAHDYFSRCDILTGYSFSKDNMAVETPLVLQNPMGGMGAGGSGMSQEINTLLLNLASQHPEWFNPPQAKE